MRTLITFVCAASLLLVGCGKKQEKASQPGENPLNAPADYLGALGQAKKYAEKTVDLAALTKAIQMFNVSEERYPTNLQELVDGRYIPEMPRAPLGMKIVYNPNTGEVKIVKQ